MARLAEEGIVSIPQRDGPPARFPPSDLKAAYLNLVARMGAGADAPPEHPLLEAARNSADPKWTGSFYAEGDTTEPIEDLSE